MTNPKELVTIQSRAREEAKQIYYNHDLDETFTTDEKIDYIKKSLLRFLIAEAKPLVEAIDDCFQWTKNVAADSACKYTRLGAESQILIFEKILSKWQELEIVVRKRRRR